MRLERWFLLELVMIVAALTFASGALAGWAQGSSYAWAQPGTAPVSTPFAQPPAWVLNRSAAGVNAVAYASGYAWAQPGAVQARTPSGQLSAGTLNH